MKSLYASLLVTGLALFSVTTLNACNYSIDKTGLQGDVGGAPSSSGGEIQAPTVPGAPALDTRLGFANVFASAISRSCFPCHAAPRNAGGLNLQKYESVFAAKDEIADAVSSKYMPDSKGRTMPDDQRALLLEWIQAGAPQEGVAVTPAPVPAAPSASVAEEPQT